MTQPSGQFRKTAILIDADNASPKAVEHLFEHDAKFGAASVRRVYGDFSRVQSKGWADLIAKHAIVPQQVFALTVSKNATDIALVIDAMDLLHTGRFDEFCLVSSDSDFTRLAARIREHGVDVHGYGEGKTPDCFRKACKTFSCLSADNDKGSAMAATKDGSTLIEVELTDDSQRSIFATSHILAAIAQSTVIDGWYSLGMVGARLNAITPGFNPKSYGSPNLSTLVERTGAFELRRDSLTVYLRPKPGAAAWVS